MPKWQTFTEVLLEKVNLRAFVSSASDNDDWNKKEEKRQDPETYF